MSWFSSGSSILVELEFGVLGFGFCGRRKTGEPGEKCSQCARLEPIKNTTHIWHRTGMFTRATLVGGERSQHCVIAALFLKKGQSGVEPMANSCRSRFNVESN